MYDCSFRSDYECCGQKHAGAQKENKNKIQERNKLNEWLAYVIRDSTGNCTFVFEMHTPEQGRNGKKTNRDFGLVRWEYVSVCLYVIACTN